MGQSLKLFLKISKIRLNEIGRENNLKNHLFTLVGLAPRFPAQSASRPGLARPASMPRLARSLRPRPTSARARTPRGGREGGEGGRGVGEREGAAWA